MLRTSRTTIALSLTCLLTGLAGAGLATSSAPQADTRAQTAAAANVDSPPAVIDGGVPTGGRDLGEPEPKRYDDHKLLRINVRSQRELMMLLNAGAMPWACRVGVGMQDFSVSPEQYELVEAAELDFEVVAENIQRLFDEEREAIEQARQQAALDDEWFAVYRTGAEVNDYIDELVDLRPDLVEKLLVGTSIFDRDIHAMRITGPGEDTENRPAVLFNGMQHAREWISVMVPMYFADKFVKGYEVDPQITGILDNVVVYIVPIVNPDGYHFSQQPGNRMWRKNRRNNPGSTCYGVDLNRNWDYGWGGPHSTSTNPCSDIFIGSGPRSGPEVAALAAFMEARPNIAAHVDIHNYSELVLHAWGDTNTPHPDADIIVSLAEMMSNAIYSVHGVWYPYGTPGQLLYMVSGSMQDWVTSIGAYGYTFEVRPSSFNPGFQLPPEEILPTSEESFAAALVMAEFVAQGVAFSFPDDLPDQIDAAGGTTVLVSATPISSGPVDPDTATMYYRVGSSGDFTALPMTWLGNDMYEASFPPTACGVEIEYYFEIESQDSVVYRSPLGAPSNTFTTTSTNLIEQTLLAESFSAGLPSDWSATGLWQATSACAVSGACEDQWMYFGSTSSCNYDLGTVSGVLTSAPVSIPALEDGESAMMQFCYNLETEDHSSYDIAEFSINGGPWVRMSEAPTWTTYSEDISAFAGQEITLQWRFDTVDNMYNAFRGWQVTDVTVTVSQSECPDCPADLNGDGEVDALDLLELLGAWGEGAGHPADLNGDGEVDALDLLILLGQWGSCP